MPRDFGERIWEYEFRHGTEPPPPFLTTAEAWLFSMLAGVIVLAVAIVLYTALHGGAL